MNPSFDADVLIVGSGFGGSVSALRLAERGHSVLVLEQGRRIGPAEIASAKQNVRELFWFPAFGLRGFFTQTLLRHVGIVGGVGVGGGSLVWGSVLLQPKAPFYRDPAWSQLGIDWEQELAAHYRTAMRMLGRATNPRLTEMDRLLQQTAATMQATDSYGPTPVGIFFGGDGVAPGQTVPDPYFGGEGPPRAACRYCGGCLTGCPHGSKNSLDYNYLHLAQRRGARILAERRVTAVYPLPEGGYLVESRHPWRRETYAPLRARRVVLSAGVLGTLDLLFRMRDEQRALPRVSPRLGEGVRTNSEAITAVLHPDPQRDLGDGVAISSDFYPNAHTHITQNRFPENYHFMRWYMTPLVDGERPLRRALRTLGAMLRRPLWRNWFGRHWTRRISVLTTMQHLDNRLRLQRVRRWYAPWSFALQSRVEPGFEAPTYLREANEAARAFAQACGGEPYNVAPESLLGRSVTAHILGGCGMGRDASEGVISTDHEVHGYPGLHVMDGACIAANLGVNPSLTITALAERFASRFPAKD
jgi:cholesterol oxidase